jgi:hypothetical protein
VANNSCIYTGRVQAQQKSKTSVHRDSNFYHITAKYQKENKQFTPQLLQIFHKDL